QRGIDQPAHQLNQVGAFFYDVGAADGFDLALLGVIDGHAEAVAADDPPAFVRNLKRGPRRVEAGVNLSCKGFELDPNLLLAGGSPALLAADIAASIAGHLHEVVRTGALSSRIEIGLMPN